MAKLRDHLQSLSGYAGTGSARGLTARDRREKGVSLIELALLCPLVILIIAGIIDFGSTLRELQMIGNAAREGARVAASFSRKRALSAGQASCSQPVGVPLTECNAASLQPNNADSVANAAKKAACSVLISANADPMAWTITPTVTRGVPFAAGVPDLGASNRDRYDMVTVNIQRAAGESNCIICWGRFVENLRPNATSSFALEESCQP